MLYIILVLLAIAAVVGFLHHQEMMKERAHLMLEAVRNKDFTFALSLHGLLPGEKALLKALNDMLRLIGRQETQTEVESWQKLTRVLTHEIMNAMTPIKSISQAYLNSESVKGTDVEEGIKAISDTSESLMTFVNNYRKMTSFDNPEPTEMMMYEFVSGLRPLYPQLHWHISIPKSLIVSTDRGMLRQVVINLLKNAVEAGATDVDFHWQNALLVSNNGAPIPPEVENEMFVPFFTTKREGSGIGLALSRQLLARQGGDLRLSHPSLPSYTVTFVLSFDA